MLITAQRVTNLTAAVGIVSWQAFWMTRLNRSITDALPTVALTELGIGLLDKLVEDQNSRRRNMLGYHLIKIAPPGGYLAHTNNPAPGNVVMRRGLSWLTDLAPGATVGAGFVGT